MTAMIRFLKFWYGQLVGRRGTQRPYLVASTRQSRKWSQGGHNAGCCFHAPDARCICGEFNRQDKFRRL